jgi:DNA-binding MarR family transcriptional regulator
MGALRNQDLRECTACACFAVRRAARVITQQYDRALRPAGLRATQFSLLTMLGVGGPLPLSRVADRLGMERTTLTRNLKPLIDAGLIGVEHGDDRRVRTIFITAKGHRAAVAALPDWRKAQRDVASQISPAVFDSLANVTQRLSSTRTRTKSAQQRQAKETRKWSTSSAPSR